MALSKKPAARCAHQIDHPNFGRVKISLNTHKSYLQYKTEAGWKLIVNVQHGLDRDIHHKVCKELLEIMSKDDTITKDAVVLHRDRLVAEAKALVHTSSAGPETAEDPEVSPSPESAMEWFHELE